MRTKFFRCPICGNIIAKVVDSGVIPVCCGKPMIELEAKTDDVNAHEKHIPVISRNDEGCICIKVGAVEHPMTPEHYIQFIYVEYKDKEGHDCGQVIHLTPENSPECIICDTSISIETIYEYCNIHGLWACVL
ncbi:MAG: hypothetical protein KBT27_14600 [Prevotellaceae bacterium]|nr:hypothetical protein [Candidatus Faecinaster equi]